MSLLHKSKKPLSGSPGRAASKTYHRGLDEFTQVVTRMVGLACGTGKASPNGLLQTLSTIRFEAEPTACNKTAA
jgi:hypothetical protein